MTLEHRFGADVAGELHQLVAKRRAESNRMAALAAIKRCGDLSPLFERSGHRLDRRRLHARHVRERDDPSTRVPRRGDAVRKRVAHAVNGRGAVRHLAAFLLEHVREREIAGPYDRDHFESGGHEVARRVGRDGHAVVERMDELAAAESRAGPGGEQHADYCLLCVHGSPHYSGRVATLRGVIRIHDITTDTDDPPRFVALYALRQTTWNGPEYAGEPVARIQKAAYPDVVPLVLQASPREAFEHALTAARRMGWHIAAAVPEEGRIEATATTPLLRFKDDVVIRIRSDPAGSRVDVRSKSRIGRSDLGANAKRIRAYFERLRSIAARTQPLNT